MSQTTAQPESNLLAPNSIDESSQTSKPILKWVFICLIVISLTIVGLYLLYPECFTSSAQVGQPSQIFTTIKPNDSLTQIQLSQQQGSRYAASSTGGSPQGNDKQASILTDQQAEIESKDQKQTTDNQNPSKLGPHTLLTGSGQDRDFTKPIDEWQRFKLTYNKSYPDEATELKRRNIFNANNLFISEFNRRGEALYTLGVNQFADLTADEINDGFVGPRMSWVELEKRLTTPIPTYSVTQTIPVDWRSTMREPINQGACKQSGLHTAISLLESRLKSDDSAHTISHSQVSDCLALQGKSPCSGFIALDEVLQFLSRSKLPPALYNESAYLVEQRQGTQCICNGCSDPDPTKPTMKPNDIVVVHQESIVDALSNSGPLGIALDASHSTFHFYKSGLYHDTNCSNQTFNYFAVLVGYFPAIQGSSHQPCFIIRNHFGPSWGESGHMRLLKDEKRNTCLPRHVAVFPTID